MSRVLCVKDDTEHRLMLDNILTSLGFAVKAACNGLEGAEAADKLQPM